MVSTPARGDSLLISRFPASVDQGAFMQAIADRVKSGSLAGIRNLHDESGGEHGTRFVIGMTRDADLDVVKQKLVEELKRLHSATVPAASSTLEALTLLARRDSGTPEPVSIDQDLATLLSRKLDDLALLCEGRGELQLQAHLEALADCLHGGGSCG